MEHVNKSCGFGYPHVIIGSRAMWFFTRACVYTQPSSETSDKIKQRKMSKKNSTSRLNKHWENNGTSNIARLFI